MNDKNPQVHGQTTVRSAPAKLKPLAGLATRTRPIGRLLGRINWHKLGIFIASVFLFMLALEAMKTGARALAPLLSSSLRVTGPLDGLGMGWLFAYLVLSGSPVAAAALTFLDAGAISPISSYAMITGSRLGASLIVLIIGLTYILRGHERNLSMITGLLTLTVTGSVYMLAFPIGYLMLSSNLFADVTMRPAGEPTSIIEIVIKAPVELVGRFLPEWAIFLLGLGVIITSFNLFDRALPKLDLKDSAFDAVSRLLYRPIVTFMLGFGVTLLTMSVSVSLGLLVPLSARGYVRRENIIPYIMGCNISTFIDTFFAALLLRNPAATSVVLTQMVSVAVAEAIILILFLRTYERAVLGFVMWVNERRRRLVVFLALIWLVPIGLLILG